MKLISNSELKQLLASSEKLRRLEEAGVDNWINYDEALFNNSNYKENFLTWRKTELDKLVMEYPDFSLTDENYNYD